jgi:hypothetical protein
MSILWRRIVWFASFAIAVTLAAWMRTRDFGWLTALGAAAVTWVIISQLYAAFVLLRKHLRVHSAGGLDTLMTPERLREEAGRPRAVGNQELAKNFEQAASAIEKRQVSPNEPG